MPILSTNLHIVPSMDPASGGMPFFCSPPAPGLALVGLVVRAGDWIDQISPIFAEMLEDGALGPAFTGPAFGGHGGQPRELLCAHGHVVTGIQTRSGHYLDAVRLHQTRWDGTLVTAESSWTAWCGAMGGAARPERLAEPTGGAIVVGLTGRAGRYIDSLGMLTAEPVRVAGTALARGTGRGPRAAAG